MYINGWKAAKEKTSCGSNVLHFGHFKATACCRSLAEFEVSMANFQFITGYSPMSWCEAINVELLKKILGQEVMWHIEKYKLIATELFGSRRNKLAITLALNKVLGYNITRQYKCPLSMIVCNAKSCYD